MHNAINLLFALKGGLPKSVLHWLRHLGGLGLILLGVLDNSVVPLPGSLDVLTILLAASQREWWWYYALMATAGAVAGGYLTYRIALREGKKELEKRVPQKQMKKIERVFGRWGFGAVVITALLPPPAPMVPFLLTAGAAQYPRKKFLSALAIYGGVILHMVSHHANIFIILAAIGVGGAIAGALYLRYRRKSRRS